VSDASAPQATVYLIRHAEKPGDPDPEALGVDENGDDDPKSLTPRGWRRAGAWAVYFTSGAIAAPQRIYASNDEKEKVAPGDKAGSHSKRPIETVSELAAKLGLTIDKDFLKGGEQDLVAAISPLAGVTLISWQHEAIPAIAGDLGAAVPSPWPDTRFDLIWRLTRATAGGVWSFDQICPALLGGDSSQPMA
jgi:broad specificity phosphatase PhoE